MAFITKVWKDRLVEYAGRRKLTNVATGEELLVDVSRSEGTVNQAGDAFSATNMNNLEQRIKNEFDNLNDSLNKLEKYSTSEQVIGTWIDGKPLYRKTFYIPDITINTGTTIESGITNIDIVKSLDGTFKFTATNDSDLFALNYIQNNYGIAIRLKPNGKFYFERSGWQKGDLVYLIINIEYTKTTTT